jgi:hypothetical protein
VVQTDELLYSGLPVDALDRLMSSGEPLLACSPNDSTARAVPPDEVVAFLQSLAGGSERL